ncbi:MAG: ParB/RepB/Spo0J family partition protein [Eubacteriales bacterium]|nr:ParB/RepB/Spo0J family partition protein [Eubacteriales bacterium]
MAGKHSGLGRGLDALIPQSKPATASVKNENVAGSEAGAQKTAEGAVMVRLVKVEPNREQPRKNFDEDSLQELADSIKQFGLLQPILVQDQKTHYEIIAGERRWRAAKLAGLKEIPVIIRDYTKQEIVEISLIENIQREDLNPIEEAQAYRRLITEFNLKQDEIADRVSKSRVAVTNSMRLLKLCVPVQQMVIDGLLSTGHARALISIEDPELQYRIAQQVFDEKLSVREVERLVKNLGKEKKEPKKERDEALEVIYRNLEERMKQSLGTKVAIASKGKKGGKVEIEFYNTDDLEKIVDRLS